MNFTEVEIMERRFGKSRFSGGKFRPRWEHPKPVEEGDEYDVEIGEIGTKGDGIARVENFVIFVPDSKQGEKCRIRIKMVRPKFAVGEKIGEAKGDVEEEAPEEGTEEEAPKKEEKVEEAVEETEASEEEKEEEAREEPEPEPEKEEKVEEKPKEEKAPEEEKKKEDAEEEKVGKDK